MVATKNRIGIMVLSLLTVALFVGACAPPGPRALVRGKKLLEAGNVPAAVVELQAATTLLPTNAAAWNYLGVAYHRSGEWTNAAHAYSQALRFDRDLLDARFNLGCLWVEQERWEQARSEFTAYTLGRPNDVEGWLKLGHVQMQSRDATAEKSFREALRIEADNVEAWNVLGLFYAQRNRGREAADAFGAALKRQTNYAPALLNLATVRQQQLGDRAGAVQLYREYLALQPRPADWASVNALVQSLAPPATAAAKPPVNAPIPARTNVPPIVSMTAHVPPGADGDANCCRPPTGISCAHAQQFPQRNSAHHSAARRGRSARGDIRTARSGGDKTSFRINCQTGPDRSPNSNFNSNSRGPAGGGASSNGASDGDPATGSGSCAHQSRRRCTGRRDRFGKSPRGTTGVGARATGATGAKICRGHPVVSPGGGLGRELF
jgi:Flp pilus assembly protein TadD